MPDVREIVTAWLKTNGYDGLCNVDFECGCRIEDLMPCDEPDPVNCVAACLQTPPPEGCDYWLCAGKPKEATREPDKD